MDKNELENLKELIENGVSPFHVVKHGAERLQQAGFSPIQMDQEWSLARGGKYFLNYHGSTLLAFTIGEEYKTGCDLRLAAAHTDFPCLRVKPRAEILAGGYGQLNVEVYGGAILNTWLDRPLGIAGRIALKGSGVFHPKTKLVHFKQPLLCIPNLAIHMNKEVNKGVELNRQTDMLPVMALLSGKERKGDFFLSLLAEELGVEKEKILDWELSVFCMQSPKVLGLDEEFFSAPRLDNLTSVEALLEAVTGGRRKNGINLIALFDHEEIGSRTKQGAGSMLLRDAIRRILLNLGAGEEDVLKAFYKSMLLSVDVAHGMHPNQMGKMDPTNQPVLGAGICIKEACAQSYATDAQAVAVIQQLCEKEGIACQKFVNRSDQPGGGTLGSIASAILPVPTVDLGVPLLAMHSACELMGTKDIKALCNCIRGYFSIA